jgi:nitrogen fixation NifU-like protein
LELALRIEGSCINGIAFKAKGCVPAMACASAVTALIIGKSVDLARAVDRGDILEAVGEVPPQSGHALDLAIDALHAALQTELKR